jgi:hypothetical protein
MLTRRFEQIALNTMEAGLSDHVWSLEEIAMLLEAKNMEAKRAKRGTNEKKTA